MATKKEVSEVKESVNMRTPFASNQISKLPKPTKAQNGCLDSEKTKCSICGGYHHPKVIHLDYVGHAALTDRLLDVDPCWTWEPLALENGLPKFDEEGGLWIKLTVHGVTRLGYGNAEAKSYMDVGAREKEVIGDALRNAGMRFGAALDLWHKGELHVEEEQKEVKQKKNIPTPTNLEPEAITDAQRELIVDLILRKGSDTQSILAFYKVKNFTEMNYINADKLIKILEAKPDVVQKDEELIA